MALSAHTPLRSGIAATTGLRTDRAATVNYAAFPDPTFNVIYAVVDDVSFHYLSLYDQTTYNPASPGSRVDPLTSWCANQWVEVAQDESTMTYGPTPFLDWMAKNGLLLERMTVASMCSPTRASSLTGRNNNGHTLGMALAAADTEEFNYEGTTIYQRMQAADSDYERLHIGKWHVSNNYLVAPPGGTVGAANSERAFRAPVERGGATYYAGHPSNPGADTPGYPFPESGQDHSRWVSVEHDVRGNAASYSAASGEEVPESAKGQPITIDMTYESDLYWQTEKAKAAVQQAASDGKPFLLNFWTHAVHSPFTWEGIAGERLHELGYHSYGADGLARPSDGTDIDELALQIKAFLESFDTALSNVYNALTAEQKASTMIVFVADNGTTGRMLQTAFSPTSLPASNPYNSNHSKGSPFWGGLGAACIIHGPAVASPGNGTVPRVWTGLAGIEDIHFQIARWVGVPSKEGDSKVLEAAVKNTSASGRSVYVQTRFVNGYADDMWSTEQGTGSRFVSALTDDGWAMFCWIVDAAADPPPTGEKTRQWQLYDLTSDPLQESDLFWDAVGNDPLTDTVQEKYDALGTTAQEQFDLMYTEIAAQGYIPPGMEVTLA